MGHLTYINTVPKGINITIKSSPTDPPQGKVLAPPDSR
jgi:hypothetical protein